MLRGPARPAFATATSSSRRAAAAAFSGARGKRPPLTVRCPTCQAVRRSKLSARPAPSPTAARVISGRSVNASSATVRKGISAAPGLGMAGRPQAAAPSSKAAGGVTGGVTAIIAAATRDSGGPSPAATVPAGGEEVSKAAFQTRLGKHAAEHAAPRGFSSTGEERQTRAASGWEPRAAL